MRVDQEMNWALELLTLSIEDKLVSRKIGLSPEEITEEVVTALAELPAEAIDENYIDLAFDVIYDAIERAVGRVK